MKLKEFNFNSIKSNTRLVNLCVMEEHSFNEPFKCYEEMTIGDTLRALPLEWAEREIKGTRWFFDTFVIEVSKV